MLTLLLARNTTVEYKKRYWTTTDFGFIYYVCPDVYLFLKDVINESAENTLDPNTQSYTII